MAKIKKSPPWVEFYNDIKVMFQRDPDIHILFDEDEYEVKLYVGEGAKADALAKYLPSEKEFGNVVLKINVIPPNTMFGRTSKFTDIFANNDAVFDIVVTSGPWSATYVVFKKEVVQYFDDNMSDINGNRSVLLEDVARRIFDVNGIFFCTSDNNTVFAAPYTISV